ncbi:hypothetical protein JRQ81_013292 [Phrynocephalus forsythii]|uniref:RING-type E3 ubiquitin transferase n=1 Tax=Phrynocephalus forsythii TaxID=171643 RepID=A0A9Q0Y0T9_9SAUR|nr:hypothetical protein JRQ81_013292 [Phrynocephalus forsythii]
MEDLVRQLGISRPFHPGGISLGQIREQVTIKFRRALYQSGVRVRNVQSGGFYRDISADFFHRNPVRLNRLVPWLKRELRVLCGTNSSVINNVQHAILNNITIYDLDSQAFADIIQPHLHRFTNHFLHEFINFARSPFNIKAYDWRASYVLPFPSCEDMFHVLFATSSSEEGDEEEGEGGETEDSEESEGDEGESVASHEEETWDAEIQRSTSSNSDHTEDEYFLPAGSSDGEPARSTDNRHDFSQADVHLDMYNRHYPLHKYIFQQLEENTSMVCKSSPMHTVNAQQNVEDDEDGDEELVDELETLRGHNFGQGAHSSASSVLFSVGQLSSSNQRHNGLQFPFQEEEEETEHMDQTPLREQDEATTKAVHPKGEDFFFIDMLQPHTGDILVIEHIELKPTETNNPGELSRQAEGTASSTEGNSSTYAAPSNFATKPDGWFLWAKEPSAEIHSTTKKNYLEEIMSPLHKEVKPTAGLRAMGRSSFIKIIPMDTIKHSKCAICLERIQDVTYLNPCKHRFCFDCVQTWSRKKVVCPVCKQHFHSFFHSVGGKGAPYEYLLPLKDSPLSHSRSNEGHASASSERWSLPPDNGIVDGDIAGKHTQKEKEICQLMRHFTVTKRPSKGAVISLGKFKAQAVLHFRRALYLAGILVQSAQNPGFSRLASAEHFAQNPSCFDRLIPWLRRELKVLCGNQRPLVHTLQGFILKNMTQYDLQSKKFEALLQPYLCQFTTHFVHELTSFAQSPYSMKKYDWHALYECPPLLREEPNPLISSASSDNECPQTTTDDQGGKVTSNPDDRKQGSLQSFSEKDLTALCAAADHPIHSKNEDNNLEDLSDSDPEQEVHGADVFTKNKLHVLQLNKKAHPTESFCHSQMLQYMKENEDTGELYPVQTHYSKELEAYKSSSNMLASGDYVALNCNCSNAAEIDSTQILLKQDASKWQCLDFPTNHFRTSSERMSSSPGGRIVFEIDGPRGAECNFEKGYTAPKERPGRRSRRRHPHEGRGFGNYTRGGRIRREQRKTSSDGSLLCKTALSLRSENIVARDMSKGKTQKPHHSRKLRSKDYECSRDRVYREPNWKHVYYRQDCKRYGCKELQGSKGETTRVSSPKPLGRSRVNPSFSPEGKLLIDQGSISKGEDHYLERCQNVGRPKGKFVIVEQDRRPYEKLGVKRKNKS